MIVQFLALIAGVAVIIITPLPVFPDWRQACLFWDVYNALENDCYYPVIGANHVHKIFVRQLIEDIANRLIFVLKFIRPGGGIVYFHIMAIVNKHGSFLSACEMRGPW